MGTLIDFEVKRLPRLLLVGKELRHNMEALMSGDNPLGEFWGECFAGNIFAPLEAQAEAVYDPSYVGAMLDWARGDGLFSYVVGMLMKPGAAVPEGYYSAALDETDAAVGYIRGKGSEDACANAHALTEAALKERGLSDDGLGWCMELYNCPRFTEPDADGNVVLDYYIPLSASKFDPWSVTPNLGKR